MSGSPATLLQEGHLIYLGTLGRMIGIKCPASQNVEHEERYTFQTTLEGRRKAQVRPRGPRTWSLQTSDATTPEQAATLMQFAQGAWGPGPFVFVSAEAPYTNLLDPAASTCDPKVVVMGSGSSLVGSPPMLTSAGWFPRSIMKDTVNGARFGDPVPVLPGVPVSGSAEVLGDGGSVRLQFLDAAGALISAHDSLPASNMVERRFLTVMPPSGAASVQLWVTGPIVQAAAPTVTWTDSPRPWSDGQGCLKAVVHGASRSLVLTGPDRTYSNLSFTVTEVG